MIAMQVLKKLVAKLPLRLQLSLKRCYSAWQIRLGVFGTDEPEFKFIDDVLKPGDCVIDVGANIGHYTLKMSRRVEAEGRVLAFEPIPHTFELLTANCSYSPFKNITLLNVAASDRAGVVNMEVPEWKETRALNLYEARIVQESHASHCYSVMMLDIDSLDIPQRVRLIKIDAEGHELEVIRGMAGLITRDKPILVVEGMRANCFLESLGYESEHRLNSPNLIWRYDNVVNKTGLLLNS